MDPSTAAGQRIYSPLVLTFYDALVLGLSCRHVWGCPAPRILAHYDTYVRGTHLDVGVGTGYFLDHCTFPVAHPSITLLDLNENSLSRTARRIARYGPRVVRGDVLQPISLPPRSVDSIGMSFLLHCLPGGSDGGKWRAFDHLASLLARDGVLFGSTALGAGLTKKTLPQRVLMGLYNRLGIFGNEGDSLVRLRSELSRRFEDVLLEQEGVVALFAARRPRGE